MSFILDALRKSDAERQRAATPGLADVRYAAPRLPRSRWVPILAAALVVVLAANLVFLGLQWLRRSPATGTPAGATVPGSVAAGTTSGTPSPAAGIRPLARETDDGGPVPEAPPIDGTLEPDVEGLIPQAPLVVDTTEPAPPPDAPPPAPIPAAPEPVANSPAPVAQPAGTTSRILPDNSLPTMEQLMGAGQLNVTLLNLDLHVYSSKAASRFVVINGRKYREGSTLTEGPALESITPDGVILSSQGRRFTLSRK